jgi:hypothetical protein
LNKQLVKQYRVKRIGGRKNGATENGVVVIFIQNALDDLYLNTFKAFIKFNHPDTLK